MRSGKEKSSCATGRIEHGYSSENFIAVQQDVWPLTCCNEICGQLADIQIGGDQILNSCNMLFCCNPIGIVSKVFLQQRPEWTNSRENMQVSPLQFFKEGGENGIFADIIGNILRSINDPLFLIILHLLKSPAEGLRVDVLHPLGNAIIQLPMILRKKRQELMIGAVWNLQL